MTELIAEIGINQLANRYERQIKIVNKKHEIYFI